MEQPANKCDMNHSLFVYKSDEKLISESLYRNLHVLCRFSEPTAEFLLVVTPHMFIKPNPKAFVVVMQFIFNCLDAAEFGKRFSWPIFDKTDETNFRKTALDYMNHLNVVHQLGLETLKLSHIHIPGGVKFIKIIHKFTYLAMKVELNKPDHGSLPNLQNIPDGDDMFAKLEQYVERGMDYAARLHVQSEKLRKRMEEMQAMMESCLDITAESTKDKACLGCHQRKWKDHLNCVVRDDVAPQLEVLHLFSKNTVRLNQRLTKLFAGKKENVVDYDRDRLMVAQKCLKKIHPDFEREIDGIVDGNVVDFTNLLAVFSLLLPGIIIELDACTEIHIEAIQYEWNEIDECDAMATKYEEAANEYKDLIKPFNEKQLEFFLEFCRNKINLPFSLMESPVVTRRAQVPRTNNRILIDDSTNKTRLFNESTVQHLSSKNTSSRTSRASLSGYKPHDAMQLLAKPKSRSNLSLSSMPKMNSLRLPFSTPKLSSTMAADRLNSRCEFKFSPNFPMTPMSVNGKNLRETTSPTGNPVRKVQRNSLNQPHIQSPSRRFYVNEIPPEFAAMMQANVNLDEIINGPGMHTLQSMNGNGQNGMNFGAANDLSNLQTDESGIELISNISDTVLNDILSD